MAILLITAAGFLLMVTGFAISATKQILGHNRRYK